MFLSIIYKYDGNIYTEEIRLFVAQSSMVAFHLCEAYVKQNLSDEWKFYIVALAQNLDEFQSERITISYTGDYKE